MENKKHTTKVDWGEGLIKYVCGCNQVIGEDVCPIHQKGITETKKKNNRTVEQVKAEEWLQENAMMYRGNNASDCIMAAYKAGYVEAWNTRAEPDWCPLEDAPDETGMAVTGMQKGYRTGQAWDTP